MLSEKCWRADNIKTSNILREKSTREFFKVVKRLQKEVLLYGSNFLLHSSSLLKPTNQPTYSYSKR